MDVGVDGCSCPRLGGYRLREECCTSRARGICSWARIPDGYAVSSPDRTSGEDCHANDLAWMTVHVGLDLRRIDLQHDDVHWSSIYACSIVRLRQLDDPGEAAGQIT